MGRLYHLELTDSGVLEPLELTAADDNAARLQALLLLGDLLREYAMHGEAAVDVSLRLTSPDGRFVYRAAVSCDTAAA